MTSWRSLLRQFAAVGVVLAVIVPATLYYLFVYQPKREQYFTDSTFRSLGVLGEQIEAAINRRLSAVRNAAGAPDPEAALRLANLMRVDEHNCTASKEAPSTTRWLRRRLYGPLPKFIGPPEILADETTREELRQEDERRESTLRVRETQLALRSTQPASVSSATRPGRPVTKRNSELYFGYAQPEPLCAQDDLDQILADFLQTPAESNLTVGGISFSDTNLFLADENGRILFERGEPNFRISSILNGSAKTDSAPTGAAPGQNAAGSAAKPDDRKPADRLPSIGELLEASQLRDISHGNQAYRLFTHPIHMSGQTWVIGIFLPRTRFDAEVASLSIGSLAYLPFIPLLVLLLSPLLKVAMMSNRNRFGRRDVWALAAGLVAASGILMTLALDQYAYSWFQSELDAQVEVLSMKLDDTFHQQLVDTCRTLDRFANERAAPRSRLIEEMAPKRCERPRNFVQEQLPQLGCYMTGMLGVTQKFGSPTPLTPKDRSQSCAPWAGEMAIPDLVGSLKEGERFVEMLVWADGCGQQWEKWDIRDGYTPFINAVELPLFRDATQQRLWHLSDGRESDPNQKRRCSLSVNVTVSPNTGETLTIASMPLQDGPEPGVATAVLHVLPFYDPVLPPGFGFAVINTDGAAVFHKLPELRLYENFFRECSDPSRLRATLDARRAQTIEFGYHGRKVRAHVRPVTDSPWALILFRDKELARTVSLDVILTWFGLLVLYLGLLGAVWLALLLLCSLVLKIISPNGRQEVQQGFAVPWPDGSKKRVYSGLIAILAAMNLLLVLTILASWGGSLSRLALCLTIPLASLACVVLALPDVWKHPTRAAAGAALLLGGSVTVVIAIADCKWASIDLASWIWLLVAATGFLTLWWIASRRADSGYVAVAVVLVLNVGVLPSLLLYRDALELGMEAFIRHGQVRIAEQLKKREADITRRYERWWNKDLLADRLKHPGDQPPMPLFWVPDFKSEQLAVAANTDTRPGSGVSLASRVWCWLAGDACTIEHPDRCTGASESGAPLCRIIERHFSALVMAWLPAYHSESMQLPDFIDARASDGRWSWNEEPCHDKQGRDGETGRAVLTMHAVPGVENPGPLRVRAACGLPALPRPSFRASVLLALAVLLLLATLYGAIDWVARKIFGLSSESIPSPSDRVGDHSAVQASHDRDVEERGVLLINPSRSSLETIGRVADRIDLREPRGPRDWQYDAARSTQKACIMVDNLDYRLDDAELNRAKLWLLESLVLGHGEKPVVVISRVDPLVYFCNRLYSKGDKKADESYISPEEIDRWGRVLERLTKITPEFEPRINSYVENLIKRAEDSDQTSRSVHEERLDATIALSDALRDETARDPVLRRIARSLVQLLPEVTREPRHKVSGRILDMARAHYRSIWSLLTDEERLVLIHLADEGLVNPNRWPTFAELKQRGLVRRDPAPHFMNDTFKKFVKSAETGDQIKDWEAAAGPSTWHRFRNVLLIVTIVVGLFFALTQPEVLGQWIGALSAVAAAVATLA